jgi:hypothetical protein
MYEEFSLLGYNAVQSAGSQLSFQRLCVPSKRWLTHWSARYYTVAYRQSLGKDFETNETTELLLQTMFSTRSVQGGHKEDNWGDVANSQLRREFCKGGREEMAP